MKNINILYTLLVCFIFQAGSGIAQSSNPQLLGIKGHNTQFAKDGKTVVYNSVTKEIRSFDIEATADRLIAGQSNLFVIDGQNVIVKDDKKEYAVSLKSGKQSSLGNKAKGISA